MRGLSGKVSASLRPDLAPEIPIPSFFSYLMGGFFAIGRWRRFVPKVYIIGLFSLIKKRFIAANPSEACLRRARRPL